MCIDLRIVLKYLVAMTSSTCTISKHHKIRTKCSYFVMNYHITHQIITSRNIVYGRPM